MPPRTTLRAAFDRGVEVRGPDDCWPWIKGTDRDGYGQIGLRLEPGARLTTFKAHVVAFEFATGAPAVGHVLHTCNTEPCCNPTHLYDGTPALNAADRVAAGTVRFRPVLTEVIVRGIRLLEPTTIAQYRTLAAIHGVSAKTIENVAKRRTWKAVT